MDEVTLLHNLINAVNSIEVTWIRLTDDNPIIGQTLNEAKRRALTSTSVVAILRNNQLMANPKSLTVFEAGNRIGLIGDPEQLEVVDELLA